MTKQFWSWVKDESVNELILDGVVASESWFEDEVTPQMFRDELAGKVGDITVRINSPGGDVSAGIAIYNYLREHDGQVTIKVDGIAASIASVIAMAGDKIVMLPGAMMMVHQPWTIVQGTSDDMIEAAAALKKFGESIVPIYAARTGLSEDRINELLKAETWMTAQDAVELGFADEMVEAKTSVSDSIKNALAFAGTVQNAVMQPAMNMQKKVDAMNTEEVVQPTVEEAPVAPVVEEVKTETPAPVVEEVKEETTNPTPVVEEEKEVKMPTQPTNSADKVADKKMVLKALASLAEKGSIRGMNRAQVIEAVKAEVTITGADGEAYVVPDAVFTEILAVTRPTDILDTFDTIPVKQLTLMNEMPSEADLARAGRWSKGELKAIQESDLAAQALRTQFLYKMQEISYADLQEDFGDILLAYIRNELPQKVTEEEERDFIVGDGRATNAPRHISSIVSLDAAAEDVANVHVVEYDGTGDDSNLVALINGLGQINVEGATYVVMNKATLGSLRGAGLATPAGLPFSDETVAGALGVERIFTRSYVPAGVAFGYVGRYVKRLTGGNSGETIEQYDIDYNNRKIEFIRPVGGAATGLASAVKINLPVQVSA